MARYLTLTQFNSNMRAGRQKRTIKNKIKAGPVTLSYITLFLIAMVCLLYLFQVIFVATKGYSISNLESEIEQLKKERGNLELEINEAQSLNGIKESIGQDTMLPMVDVKFVAKDGTIASR
ncbi:MAG: hypothetical protein ACD_63C00125G0006 [uncultured bacterium]|nr:MAG: hypothetical protein ACD_63C00125G0006 [uncultured bacterium]